MEKFEIKYDDYCKRVDEVMSFYQSKRAKLKKQLTHWIVKFMIVKAENNKLRRINFAITKRNSELIAQLIKHEAREFVKTLSDPSKHQLGESITPCIHKEAIKC